MEEKKKTTKRKVKAAEPPKPDECMADSAVRGETRDIDLDAGSAPQPVPSPPPPVDHSDALESLEIELAKLATTMRFVDEEVKRLAEAEAELTKTVMLLKSDLSGLLAEKFAVEESKGGDPQEHAMSKAEIEALVQTSVRKAVSARR